MALTLVVILFICCCFADTTLKDLYEYPHKARNHFSIDESNERGILNQIIAYSSRNISHFPMDPSQLKKLAQTVLNITEAECKSLNLSSNACYNDCIYYLDPLTLITNMSDPTKIRKVLQWYAMGGGPVSYYDAGNPDMCRYVDGTYCFTPIVQKTAQSPMASDVLMQHGCCVPGTCVGDDAVKVVQKNLYCYQGFNITYNQYMYKGMGDIANTCEPLERDWNSLGPVVVMCIFGAFLLLVIAASVIQQFMIENEFRKKHISLSSSSVYLSSMSQPHTALQAYLYCFSIQRIWSNFVRRRPTDKSQFNFLDGIRVGSMSWVIYGHAIVFFLGTGVSNIATLLPAIDPNKAYDYDANKWYMLIAEYGFYSVDSFFWLSGFLATFSIVRQVTKYGDKAVRLCYLWIPMSYLARVLRIVPMMMFVTAIQWQISDQLAYGYHVTSRTTNSDACDKNWYKILLFYANLEDDQSAMSCMGHLWYIQCDMQFFLILPFLVLAFQWKKIAGLLLTLLPIFGSIAKRIYFAVEYEFTANLIYPPAYKPPHPETTFGDSYFKPIPRSATYFVGVFTMFLILMLQQRSSNMRNPSPKYTISEGVYFVLMGVAGFILLSLVFWPYSDVKDGPHHRWSVESNQWYYTLSRPAWGMGLSLFAFAFTFRNTFRTGRTSFIKTVLSAEIWQPIGKLTYTMYLTHLLIFMWWIEDLAMPQYYSYWYVFFVFCGIWCITFCVSLVLFFVMEQPMATMVSLFIQFLNGIGNKVNRGNANNMKYSVNSQDVDKKSFHDRLLSEDTSQRSSRDVVEVSDAITVNKGSTADRYRSMT